MLQRVLMSAPYRRFNVAPKLRIKVSAGVACCRFNDDSKPEILLICKRYTYAFNSFAHSKYSVWDNDELITMFNGMTIDEKVDILSLNFTQIWYRVWLNAPRNSLYYSAKNKYETAFLPDNGARLRRLISKSVNADRIWEIPKGRKNGKNEPDLQCAIREFTEETGIHKKTYKVFPYAKRFYSYTDAHIKYENTYFIAITRYNGAPKVHLGNQTQIDEICDIKWMTIENIRLIDISKRLETFIKPIFNFIKKSRKLV